MPSRASPSNNLIKKNADGILLTNENNSNHDNLVDGNDVEDNIPDCGVAQRDERPPYELLHDHTHQVRRHHQSQPAEAGEAAARPSPAVPGTSVRRPLSQERSVRQRRPARPQRCSPRKDLRPPESRACAAHPCY
jgi:hypothetical protein